MAQSHFEPNLSECLALYNRFFFTKCRESRSRASCEINRYLKRERGSNVSLGLSNTIRARNVSISELTYKEISAIFAYLDAETILLIHSSSEDIR